METEPIVRKERECGDCAMCCKLLPIEEPAKKAGVWCSKWDKGCTIYDDRWEVCRVFNCFWKMGLIPEELAPNKSKVVLASYGEELIVYCDPSFPDAWHTGKMGKFLRNWGEKFLLQKGESQSWVYPQGVIDEK